MEDKWQNIKMVLNKSKRKIKIYQGSNALGIKEYRLLNIPEGSVLSSVISNSSGICVDDWIRILGQEDDMRHGVKYYNRINANILDCPLLDGLFIVANDVVGGIFAINISRYDVDISKIWYFAPDTLEWESLGMEYFEFIAWISQGNIDEFYSTMRWDNWRKDCNDLSFEKAYLIYPFLWAKECEINSANKKIVPFSELISLNFEYASKL